jgi:hypothetical protein
LEFLLNKLTTRQDFLRLLLFSPVSYHFIDVPYSPFSFIFHPVDGLWTSYKRQLHVYSFKLSRE